MRSLARLVAAAALLGLPSLGAGADIKPHALFSDGAVLQRGMAIPVWGTADPGEPVDVSISRDGNAPGPAKHAIADKDGNWRVDLPAIADGGGPYELHMRGRSSEISVRNVLVGEVWVCSGQSNMEWSLKNSHGGKSAIKNSTNPRIRLFKVTNGPAMTPEREAKGKWSECDPQSTENFSAVGYFFGRYLQQKLGVPIGLIQNAWGGTPAEVWTSRKTLESDPMLTHLVSEFEQHIRDYPGQLAAYEAAVAKYKEEAEKAKAEGKPEPKAPAKPVDVRHSPGRASFLLYNSRIATIIPYAIRGAIWYQGESNAGPVRAEEYATLFPAMIKNWRQDWGQGDFPFLFVQLAPFMDVDDEPTDTPWAWLREAQRRTSLTVPNTAMAVTTDVGEENDIHPRRKQPVGERLAKAALALAYGQDVPYTGPVYDSLRIENGEALLNFKNAGHGLEARGDELTGFTIAGKGGKFVPAKAVIQDNRVVVSSPEVPEPVAVRYGWANFPVGNLWGKDGLPASPFRTDNFPPPWKKE